MLLKRKNGSSDSATIQSSSSQFNHLNYIIKIIQYARAQMISFPGKGGE